jgi:hypothetical protein
MKQTENATGRKPNFEERVDAERADPVHWALEKAVVDLCRADGLTPLTNKHVDLLCHRGTISVIFEIKSCPAGRVGERIRQGIYQLLEYRFLYREILRSDVRLCVVVERCPGGTVGWLSPYMEHLGVGMLWKDELRDALLCNDFSRKLLSDIMPGVMQLPLSPPQG